MSEIQDNNIEREEELNPQKEQEETTPVQESQDKTEDLMIREEITIEVEETDKIEEEVTEETDKVELIEAGEFSTPKKGEEEEEEVQQLHTKHPHPEPVIDHRLLAGKLSVYNWLSDLPAMDCVSEVVEVRFKNTRKGFYSNPSHLPLKEGDIVAVEAALGHDIGIISLTGELVKEQIRLKRIDLERNPLKKVYRKAKPHDIENGSKR